MNTKIIDCTLRDGGHTTGWNFSLECVKDSYQAAAKAGVDFFEIGYRFQNPDRNWGEFAKCNDDLLMNLIDVRPECKISVMAEAGKSTAEDFRICDRDLTIISLVRVSSYSHNLDKAFELCEKLHKKGYEVYLNLMAISEYKNEDFEKIRDWENASILGAIYFADSFGTFEPDDIEKYYNILKSYGFENIGLHSHNNLQLAFANTLRAIKLNFYSVDVSIYGMGRDAGNLPAEILTGYLNKKGLNYNPVPYIDVIKKYYLDLFNQNPWGYHVKSLIGGLKNVHPTYITELFKQNLPIERTWEIADEVKKNAPISFDEKALSKIIKNF